MSTLNVFDAYGFIRSDLTDAELSSVIPSERKVLFSLLEAHNEVKATEEATVTGEADKRKAMTALDRAKAAYELAKPKWTAHDEWRRTVARLPQEPPDPAVEKKAASALKVVVAAEQHLAACVAAITPALTKRQEARAIYAKRLIEWSKLDTRPKNVGDLIKERSRVETAQKLKNIAEGLPADYVADSVSTVGPSHLDRVRSGAGKGGSINHGYSTNKMRGANVADIAAMQARRVPSER